MPAVASTSAPVGQTAQLDELRKQVALVADPPPDLETPAETVALDGKKPSFMQGFDSLVRRHPRTAVATAAAGGFIAGHVMTRKTGEPKRGSSKAVATITGGTLAVLGMNAVLAHQPDLVSGLASFLALAPEHVAAGWTAVMGVCGALGGRQLVQYLAEKKNAPQVERPPKAPLSERLESLAREYSGPLVGALTGAWLTHAGLTGSISMAVTSAVGMYAGLLMGKVVSNGITGPWQWIVAAAPLAAGLAATHSGVDPVTAAFWLKAGALGSAVMGIATARHQGRFGMMRSDALHPIERERILEDRLHRMMVEKELGHPIYPPGHPMQARLDEELRQVLAQSGTGF